MINKVMWSIFLPFLICAGLYISAKTFIYVRNDVKKDVSKWSFKKAKKSISISLASKIGTGAIIGVLAAMWRMSDNGIGGEAIVLWVLIGMLILVPLTYCEVLLCQITVKTPRRFIEKYLTKKAGAVYTISLVVLYSFGFVGFQLSGIQSVFKMTLNHYKGYTLSSAQVLAFIIVPILIFVGGVVLTKSYELFVNVLGSMISVIILIYVVLFATFLFKTANFVPEYFSYIMKDFLTLRSFVLGLPIGLVIGLQRIIQISETGLGTSAIASSDSENFPRREATIQMIATIISVMIAVLITSYIFTYGRYNVAGVELAGDGFVRITGYFESIKEVLGMGGIWLVLVFFVISGMTTVLGSFHFINRSMNISENGKIILYLTLISTSGLLSINSFDVIFDIADLLMFVVSFINVLAMLNYIKTYKRIMEKEDLQCLRNI